MTLSNSICKCFNENNNPTNNTTILDTIIKNNYFEFNGTTPAIVTVSYTLHRLFKKNVLGRVKKTTGKGYLYYLIKTEKVVAKVVEKVVEEKVEKVVEEKVIEQPSVSVEEKVELEHKFQKITGLDFQSFYIKYKPKLVWYLTRYTRDQEIAEDFADDAFIQSLLKIDNYNSEKSQIHTWIYKIAENLVKKDFKDKKKMSVVSLDKENGENLNLINIIPNGSFEESNKMERDSILIKKAEIVKDAIFSLPDKYKKVMILRELQNKPYIDIAEICVKETEYDLFKEEKVLPSAIDFLDLKIVNNSNSVSYVNITYSDGVECTIQFKIDPFDTFFLSRDDIENVSHLEVISTDSTSVSYRMTTNLSTIKSQISKGRQLIQSMVSKKFKILDDQGLPDVFGEKKKIDIFEGDDTFETEDLY